MASFSRTICAITALIVSSLIQAQEALVDLKFPGNDGAEVTVEATITLPANPGVPKRPAVVILHHAGGWGDGTTKQYASFLASNGFVVLEPRMFNTDGEKQDSYRHLPTIFGSLAYLAKRPDVDDKKIALMGLSFGANLTLYAGTGWAIAKYPLGELRYAALASFYPLCWIGTAVVSRTLGRWQNKAYPESFMDKWAGIPLAIFAGGLDDYDSRDPKSCTDFVAAIPDEKQRALTQVHLYPSATHGWDHGKTFSFFARTACKGSGCKNTNESNPEVTQTAKSDLLKFLQQKLGI
jgi:dienelactone hydrolase